MSGQFSVSNLQKSQNNLTLDPLPEKTEAPKLGKDGGRKVSALIQQFEGGSGSGKVETPKSKGPPSSEPPKITTRQRSATLTERPVHLGEMGSPSKGPPTEGTTRPRSTTLTERPTHLKGPEGPTKESIKAPELTPQEKLQQKTHQENIQKFGSKTANLYEMERIGVKVPERSPVSTKEIFDHLLSKDKDNVIRKSWDKMKLNGKIDDVNLKKITDKIGKIFDDPEGFPFTPEQKKWITETMAGKVIIARSTGDEDSADTPNAGGNESVLFVEPTTASVTKAMKEVVLSYFGADSLRNRIVGDGMGTVLAGLPKMPVLLMEMIAEPIKTSSNQDVATKPPIGIAMSTDKVEFTGGEDFHFVSISSAVGPGVNEGSGRIEVDETFVMQSSDGTPLLIYQQPSIKEERIRAVKDDNGKISSQMEKNSKELAYSPSLSRDQVGELVKSTNKIKGLNGGSTTEVEGVVGGSDKQLNFVQHRPIPDTLSKVPPTYVNTTQSKDHSQVFNYTTVVPKSGDALVITDWSQVCFAETMKDAEAMFDWTGGTQKLVIVRQPDCSNSHPAVNFGSYKKVGKGGEKEPNPIPCLVVPNFGELMALKEKNTLSGTKPFVIDGQTQQAFVWTDDTFRQDTAISSGRVSHHIGLETGVKLEGVPDLVSKLKTSTSGEIGKLKGELEPILTHYEKEIARLEKLLSDGHDTIHNAEGLGYQLKTTKENFKAVKEAFEQVIAGNPKYTFDEGTHGRLLLVKFLEASLHDIEGFPGLIDAGKSATRYLQAMKGSPVAKPVFGDESNLSTKEGLTGPVALRWKRFLALAEQSGLSEKDIAGFKGMMENLDKTGITATWMATVFDKMYAQILPPRDQTGKTSAVPKAKELLQALVKDYETTAPFIREQQAFQKKLDDAERGIADFSTKSKFQKAFDNLKSLADTYIQGEWPKDLAENPLKKATQIESLGRMIEVYDSSIKALKNSDFDTPELLEKQLEMLDTFKEMFEQVFTKTDLPSGNHDPKSSYILKIDQAYTTIKEQVTNYRNELAELQKKDGTLKGQALEEHNKLKQGLLDNLNKQFRCDPKFTVTACLYNNRAKVMPKNVEELFTTLHQSLEDIRGGLMVVGGSNYDIDLPKEMASVLSAIPQLSMLTLVGVPPLLVGREITSSGVTYTHNLIVNDHGVKIKTSYEKPTSESPKGKTFVEIDFYADNTGGRTENMALVTKFFSPGSEVVWGDQGFRAKIEVKNEAELAKLTVHLQKLIQLSISTSSTALGLVARANGEAPSTGSLDKRRERMMNDFLNVAFGVPPKPKPKKGDEGPPIPTINYNVKFGYPKSIVDPDTGKAHKLDLSKPNFGLSTKALGKLPQKVLDKANQTVLDGPTKLSFKRNGKTYPIDLTKSDLGLTETAITKLGLNKAYLSAMRDDMVKAMNTATVEARGKNASNLGGGWPEHLYGETMAYTMKDQPPELTLWNVATTIYGKPRIPNLKLVDDAFAATTLKKYALREARQKFVEEGSSASPKTVQNYHTALKEYHLELQKTEVISFGYQFAEQSNTSKVKQLTRKTRTERAAIETELQLQKIQPQMLTREEKLKLPMGDKLPELATPGKPPPKIVPQRVKGAPVKEDRVKIGGKITELNKEILGAISSLKDEGDKDNYAMAVGLLESSRHLIREADLSKIESTWKTEPKEAIKQILNLDLVSGVSDVDALSKPGGVKVGLSNGGADCFINSSLQLLAGVTGIQVPKDMPHLAKFLTGDIQSSGDCRNLRRELQAKAFQNSGDIRDAIVGGTAVSQQDAAETVALLLGKIKAPKLEFTKEFTRGEDGLKRNGSPKSESVLPLNLPEGAVRHTLGDIFTSNLTSQLEIGNWDDVPGNKLATQTLTLKDNSPDTAVVSLTRFSYDREGAHKRRDVVTGITNPISMVDQSGVTVRYQANSIICHLGAGVDSGHYVTYRKEGGNWLLFNDNSEVGVQVDLDQPPHKDRIERDSYVVGMTKVGKDYTAPVIPHDLEAIPPQQGGNRGPISTGGSDKQVKSGGSPSVTPQSTTPTPSTTTPSPTLAPWKPTSSLGIAKSQLQKPNVLSGPTRPQTGVHEFHTKAFKALFEGGITFPSGEGIKPKDTFNGKVTIEGKQYNLTATAMAAKGSGAVIWTASLSEEGGGGQPTEFVVKSNPKKVYPSSLQVFGEIEQEKNFREIQVLEHMSGNDHALQFHGAYAMPDGTLVYGMEKGGQDLSKLHTTQVQARTTNTLVPTRMDKHLLEMAQALRDVHATGQVHGDVKLDNFMLGSGDTARIGDFGECFVTQGQTLQDRVQDDLQRFASQAFNLRYGLSTAHDNLHTAIAEQQKILQGNFDKRVLEMETALTLQISDLNRLNPDEPLIKDLQKQLTDLRDPAKQLDTIVTLSGGKLTDEGLRSYLINDLLLKTLQTPAPTLTTMEQVSAQLEKLIA